ncbi:hypothetical protein L1887_07183 [Cichorium endivia]|nr:hypothetical protein L1887_07183 [Cichorium endivia]
MRLKTKWLEGDSYGSDEGGMRVAVSNNHEGGEDDNGNGEEEVEAEEPIHHFLRWRKCWSGNADESDGSRCWQKKMCRRRVY